MTETSRSTLLRLVQAHARLSRRAERGLSAHGLSLTELLILMHLERAPGGRLRRIDLAERLAMSASSVTRLLAPMEKIGLVTREKHARDARVAFAALTPAGALRVEEARATLDEVSEDLVGAALDEREAARLGVLLGKLTPGAPGDLAAPPERAVAARS